MSVTPRIPAAELRRFATELLQCGGVEADEARITAEVAVWNDLVGRPTQGVERLPTFLTQVATGAIQSPCAAILRRTGPATAQLDGNRGLGYVLGARAVDEVAALAAESGIGAVGVRRSNHLGSGAAWAHRLADRGFVSIVVSNSFAKVAPPGGSRALLGTNPFAFGCPGPDGRSILVDFATAASSGSAIRAATRAGEPIAPDVLATTAAGTPVLQSQDGKGFALALCVEVLAGVLTGAAIGTEVGSMFAKDDAAADVGHCFVALDPKRFDGGTNFMSRIAALLASVRSTSCLPDAEQPRVPGDERWARYEDNLTHGVELPTTTREDLAACAAPLSIKTPW